MVWSMNYGLYFCDDYFMSFRKCVTETHYVWLYETLARFDTKRVALNLIMEFIKKNRIIAKSPLSFIVWKPSLARWCL